MSVSLDRMTSSKHKPVDEEPPVSNSLMAAIKRSQANQRRHPETFHLYQMHQQLYGSQSSLSCVKVELKHFILSILDDPIVSRVFGDAGFRSCDIKIAILHPSPLLKFPPLFLCNLPDSNTTSSANRIGFNFPFAVDQGEQDYKRISQVLVKKESRNPLLIGVCAENVVKGFKECINNGKDGFLDEELRGLCVVDIDKDINEFGLGNLSEELMDLKFKEVRDKVASCESCGVIADFGDLKVFNEGGLMEYVVSRLSGLVRACGGKLWLIGSVGSYEVYMKILAKFPGLEKDWDLNLVPITSSKLDTSGSHLKSSFMGSFVPFGGFFPVPSELDNASSRTNQSITRCDLCNEKYEHEVSIILKGGRTVSVSDQQSAGVASWLQVPETDTTKGNSVIEAKDHGDVFNARVEGLQRKWSDICHRLHHNVPLQQNSLVIRPTFPFPHHFQPNANISEVSSKDSNQENNRRNPSPPVDFFATSSSPPTSITTDLGLGTIYVSPDRNPKGHEVDEMSKRASNEIAKSCEKDYKQLYKALSEKVRYQNDAVSVVSQTISRIRTAYGRRHVWLTFSGSDIVSKKKLTTALAEVVFCSRESLISIDLNFENQIHHRGSIFDHQGVNLSDPSFRGKTITNYIAEELTKRPQTVVFLEHIDKADFLTKDNLSRAIKSGKLSDARGREIRITDAIFVTTTSKEADEDDFLMYSEERVLNAKASQLRISTERTEPGNSSLLLLPKESVLRNPEMSNKRKFTEIGEFEILVPQVKKIKSCFDLNLPLEEAEESESDTVSDSKDVWLEEFLEQMDEKVVFEPFDFDSHSETILKEISKCFKNSFGTNVVLEIENEVMLQILASCWLSDRAGDVEKWIGSVLYSGFMDAREKQGGVSERMVKLVAVQGTTIEDDALCACLPSRIIGG